MNLFFFLKKFPMIQMVYIVEIMEWNTLLSYVISSL